MSDHGTDCVCAECFPKKLRFPYSVATVTTKDGAAHGFMLAGA